MTPFLWFSLSLRIIGAWTMVSAVEYLVAGFNVAKGFFASSSSTWAFINQGIAHVAIGLVLVKFAPMLAAMVYMTPTKPQSEPEEETDAV